MACLLWFLIPSILAVKYIGMDILLTTAEVYVLQYLDLHSFEAGLQMILFAFVCTYKGNLGKDNGIPWGQWHVVLDILCS